MDEKCAVCSEYFNQNNLAWIISFCGHNICTHCLKHAKASKVKQITCKQCKEKYNVDQETLEEFPKNITILKLMKQNKNGSSIISESNSKKSEDSSLLLTDSLVRSSILMCAKHGKPLEIICTVDRQFICSSCALFGEHKNHNANNNSFRTLEEFQSDLSFLKQRYREIEFKRQLSEQNIRGKKYRSSIISKISDKKDKLVIQIKQNFQRIVSMIKDAENKVFQQLIKSFRVVDSQISKATKEEQSIEKEYNRWKKQIATYLKQIDENTDIKAKINIFYRQNRPSINIGQNYLTQIQLANNQIRTAVQEKINSLRIQYSPSIEGVIYNYANVIVNQSEIKVKSIKDIKPYVYGEVEEPRNFKKQMKIQFVKNESMESIKSDRQIPKADEATRLNDVTKTQRNTLLLHKVKSNPKLPKAVQQQGKKSHTPPKFIQNIKSQAEQKRNQNLQFAERMLNQFLKSTDTLDITGCQLNDEQILHIISTASKSKYIKCIKLCRNKLTNNGLIQIIEHLPSVTNINLSYNLLSDESIDIFIDKRQIMPCLRIINLSHNKLNERKIKTKVEELRKVGIITTL